MDIEGLEGLLRQIEKGEVDCVARDLPEPSPLAHEILNARPLCVSLWITLRWKNGAHRRSYTRRASDSAGRNELGILDAAAIDRVCEEAWPQARTADELHEALLCSGL